MNRKPLQVPWWVPVVTAGMLSYVVWDNRACFTEKCYRMTEAQLRDAIRQVIQLTQDQATSGSCSRN